MSNIAILGAGTWGLALGRSLANAGNGVVIWSALENEIISLQKNRTHPKLDSLILPDSIEFSSDIGKTVKGKDVVVFAVPSVFIRQTASLAAPFLCDCQIIVDVSKGLEAGTHKTLSEVIGDEISPFAACPIVVLSGPTHAEEVVLDMPCAIVAASKDLQSAQRVQNIFSTEFIRVYTNDDVKGIEICGALKNIIALAAGMSQGLGNGDNTRAAIITRGMMEITRLGCRMGCSHRTFESLAGIGDLVVTCTSSYSRNNQAGELMGRGLSASEAVARVGMVVEGLNALPAALELSELYGVELPICESVSRVVKGEISARGALDILMKRKLKPELDAE